ncbi:MAG: S8 family serine peptidase, partial [Lachnospiraceae bacterium]|nr:S8 family serine peptidase [Lachnospiraceae bacterium]
VNGGYEQVSGTSFATPFVTGAAALLMEWGIVRGNDRFLYGERLKAALIRGAQPLPGVAVRPDSRIGWGTLCAQKALESMQ